ncbi:MAG: hypothetical protein COB78_08770 [Hyphomicrobiales bacterium]|nr:MAG: hypothetical protein COB78_08770 [Hyphomicrobiales bacterium]
MENVTAQIFRIASASFSIGGRSFAANTSSLVKKDLADSASTIPSVSVMGGQSSRSSRAMDRIFDIVRNMDKSKHHHHKHSQATEALAAKESDSGASASFRIGGNGFDAIKGSSDDDTINYSSASARAVSTYIDGGGGDDVINVASTAYGEQRIYGGEGDDTISLSGRNAHAYGGDGDDVIKVAGLYVGAEGGAGDDEISVSGEIVRGVSGGEGDDTITVNGKIVGTIEGGAGDDVITVSSENVSTQRWGSHGNFGFGESFDPTIIGGEGNDTISVDGKARIVHRAGDGQDVINITDTTDFATFGEDWFDDVMRVDEANFSYENGELTVTFDGRDEKLTIRSDIGELSWEITSDRTFVVTINKAAEGSEV